MQFLKQSTAATIKLGAFVDDTDGKTAETGLTISQADIRLSKNGGDIAQTNNAAGATHDEFGYYDIPLDTTDTNTLGRLRVAVSAAGALPVWQDFLVVTANVYDTLCSTDSLDVNVTALANDVITSNAFDESSAYPLKSADTGATQVARVGADSDTLETLSDQLDTVQAKTDLLDLSAVSVSSPISGTTITILRGDTLEVSISDLGSLASYVSLDFTVKSNKAQADSDALIRIRLNATGLADGLLTLNGATPTSADDGSIAITDATDGDITITLAASCTDDLPTGTYAYDVQLIEVGDVSTLTSGKATVTADVTRAVS